MQRFWIKIEPLPYPSSLNSGCGITANSADEAAAILLERAAAVGDKVSIVNITQNIDISTLDQKHVVPNMGNIFRKGIWWPNGYGEK